MAGICRMDSVGWCSLYCTECVLCRWKALSVLAVLHNSSGTKVQQGCSLVGFCSCLLILQKKPPRENGHKQISGSSTGCLSSPNASMQSPKHEWKIVASEKTSSKFVFSLSICKDSCQFTTLRLTKEKLRAMIFGKPYQNVMIWRLEYNSESSNLPQVLIVPR